MKHERCVYNVYIIVHYCVIPTGCLCHREKKFTDFIKFSLHKLKTNKSTRKTLWGKHNKSKINLK